MDLGAPGAFKFSFELNTKRPPLDNKKVRQALAWASDRKRFTETGLYGLVPQRRSLARALLGVLQGS